MSVHHVAPHSIYRSADGMAEGVVAATRGATHILLVKGELGRARLGSRLDHALTAVDAPATAVPHTGPCTDAAIAALAKVADRATADLVLAVGGGRVLDTAKAAAAALGAAFVAVPTSPATCAAATPTSVVYDDAGAFLRTVVHRRAPDAIVLDSAMLGGAPDRLLVAGMIDALAKVYEVRHTVQADAMPSVMPGAALALCDQLETMLHQHGNAALRAGGSALVGSERDVAKRQAIAEACIVLPALIGGLAGEEAKTAAAHPLHNALTSIPESKGALHGELIGFGILVQLALAGRRDLCIRAEATRFARWGACCDLESLGCGAARSSLRHTIATRATESPPMRKAFPKLTPMGLEHALLRVDTLARETCAAVAGEARSQGCSA